MPHLATVVFSDIGLFQRPRKRGAEQIMLTPTGPVNREDTKAYVDAPATTIPAAMLANMYRVLLGVRPVPTFRGATQPHKDASACDLAEDLARRCLVDVESGVNRSKDNEPYLIRSPQMTAKASDNSWAKSSVPWAGPDPLTYRVSWHSVASEFGQVVFAAFRDVVSAMLGEAALELDMVTVFSALYKAEDKTALLAFFAEHNVSKAYYDTLINGKTSGQYFGHTVSTSDPVRAWKCHTVTRGVNEVSRRSGRIRVLIDDETKARLQRGPGMATLLDGGVAELRIETNMPDTMLIPGEPAYRET